MIERSPAAEADAYNLAVCIGVSDPGKPMPVLPGAINGAVAFATWAKSQNYDCLLVTDADGEKVTLDYLKGAIQPVLDEDHRIGRLIVYFAGHGFAEPNDDFWLLSGFGSEGDAAVHVNSLRNYLVRYQPEQLALIGDACRTFEADFSLLRGSGVVTLPNIAQRRNVEVETLKAASLGDAAYMEKNEQDAKARCLFSEMLLNALSGAEAEAIEDRGNDRVVSSKALRLFLEKQSRVTGGRLRLSVKPEILPGFQYPHDCYVRLGPPPQPGDGLVERGDDANPPFPPIDEEQLPDEVDVRSLRLRDQSARDKAVDAVSRLLHRAVSPRSSIGLTRASDTSLIVAGLPILRMTISPWVTVQTEGVVIQAPGHFRLDLDPESYRVALEIEGDLTVCSYGLRYMDLALALDGKGGLGAILRDPQMSQEYRDTEQAMAALVAGDLAVTLARDLAMTTRIGKHRDFSRGVIAAYLYDRVGDIDSIRQLAWFYAHREQPIPFDIALLADLAIEPTSSGCRVRIPAVESRPARSDREETRKELLGATSEAEGRLAGTFPMLREGWSHIPGSRIPNQGPLLELSEALTLAPVTTLRGDGGRLLANLIEQGKL